MEHMSTILGAASLFLLTVLNLRYRSHHTGEVPTKGPMGAALRFLLNLTAAGMLTLLVLWPHRASWYILTALALSAAYWAVGTHAITKAGLFLFQFVCLIGVMNALFALVLGRNLREVVVTLDIRFWCCAVAMGVQFILSRQLEQIHGSVHFDCLYHQPQQLGHVQTITAILFLFRLVFFSSFFYDHNEFWFKAFILVENTVLLLCYYISLSQTVRYCVWMDQEVRIQLLETQLDRQRLHYQGYQRYVDQFRQFRTEYEELVSEVRACMMEGGTNLALTLLDDVEARAEGVGSPRVRYSNHYMVDSVLQDTALACQGLGIDFDASVCLPTWTGLTDLDLCRIFHNLCKNAIEACTRLPCGSPARIVFTSGVFGAWLTITAENSFNGTLRIEDDGLKTTKGDDALHGLGLSSVKSILESRGGFFRISAGPGEEIFKISLHLCRPSGSAVQ